MIFVLFSGAFRVATRKEGRNLECRYDPREAGIYFINVFWSGDHVPGSPYKVYIARSQGELERYQERKQLTTTV